MVEIKTDLDGENLREYYKFNIFKKTKLSIILFIVLAALYLLLIVGCLVLFFMFELFQGIIFAGLFTLIFFGGLFLVKKLVKSGVDDFVKNTLENEENNVSESVIVTKLSIVICKNGEPLGELKREKIKEIYFNDKANAIYLIADEGSVLILENKNIVKGTIEELRETMEEMRREQSK